MSIKHITTNDLCHMRNTEGLVLQGCGGDLREWVDGINEMLTEEGILRDGSKFSDCLAFEHDGLTCLLFPFEGVNVDMGRLAIWRLKTHDSFGGTWLSDYVPNRLGGFESSPLEEPVETEDMDGGLSMK
ncbi:hypothetical protein I5Q82_09240 [Acutalibacter muris]|uniref:Uncharacterized protein n=1 Tax=Acutalibacter muris TaxID=1796620 RepID=A0AA92QVF7_9FIRM|nr:hypothetical protein I5Q82_13290 [Acutalibacter muris]QQR31814.1 hypothetical protein I5Q82_09240 [Acutalibacter muris]